MILDQALVTIIMNIRFVTFSALAVIQQVANILLLGTGHTTWEMQWSGYGVQTVKTKAHQYIVRCKCRHTLQQENKAAAEPRYLGPA